jgi:alkylation response protein AidB-like acyl-CoA dehydrogenase
MTDDPTSRTTSPTGTPSTRSRRAGAGRRSARRGGQGFDLTASGSSRSACTSPPAACGACDRLIELGTEWALEREQFGGRIFDHQAISFMLADCAAEVTAARLLDLLRRTAARLGRRPKLVHRKASMAKLIASETAGRVADRVVQIFGGRGYMRRNPAERLWRELRVDRIWEGTSEIQRLIISRGLERRGRAAAAGALARDSIYRLGPDYAASRSR